MSTYVSVAQILFASGQMSHEYEQQIFRTKGDLKVS